ncbi:hypothetical protein PR202_ga27717 [Eleusine coracana subsp. coracana]|uniref:PI3K/PI4K catalytic domain-containing protein n=1 Tax=Eleusine coracana subsp. coracana TaxID=191504 RepID=A0AAV5DF90_ELECO|nr:hypothetical protein PR202_ga27717 [Eleusine coracana subsp. coracana]
MAGGSSHNEFRFFLSCDISLPLAFRVLHAEHILSAEKKVPELFVECKLYIDGLPFGLPVKTRCGMSHLERMPILLVALPYFFSTAKGILKLEGRSYDYGQKGRQMEESPPQPLARLLQTIIKFPPTRALEVDEKQLVWKFRFSLMSEKKALTKFVRSVDWSDNQRKSVSDTSKCTRISFSGIYIFICEAMNTVRSDPNDNAIQEAKQAIELIGKWETIDVADALELLSPDFESDESVGREDGDEDGFRLWQSLFRQTELTAQLCTIMKDVIQTVSLMDRLLKLENLDLHLTPYRVLATGQDEGMLEFVPSSSLAQILSEHRGITSYLQKFHPDEDGPFGITVQCLETFIKSCAGYSVITYILGVGDRHLDNLLLTDDGRLFHVDFAFILGRDPKPFPPPMKLCKEMVEAMGGAERFKSYCCEAYNILRKSSSLILNLFKLMERSGIPDISSDESGGLKLQEKFRLDLDDEEAIHFFQDLINESVSALFPQMVETIHRWAQYWR